MSSNNMNVYNTSNRYTGILFFIFLIVIVLLSVRYIINDLNNNSSNEPWLIHNTKMAKKLKVIPGKMIPQSIDQQYGIEFSYSFWMYISDWTYKKGAWKHVMHKGSKIGLPLQSPGFWLYPYENKLAINMNTFHSVKESCDIGNIPIGKWVNIITVVMGKNMDVYVNGELKKRCTFKGIPRQNYGDIYINDFQGFDGFMSKVRYFNYALPYYKVEQIVSQGPSKAPCVETGETPPYLADNYWLTTGFPNSQFPN